MKGTKSMSHYSYLLEQYRLLWNNRTLSLEESSENTLIKAIKRELLDENTHPRIRRGIHEKFYFAVKRINASSLSDTDKENLITLYVKVVEQLKQRG